MNKQYLGDWAATILSYDAAARTARISIPTVTDGLDEGIIATFAYPVGDDDKDTEREILAGAECYIFFLQGQPEAPVIWAYRSHGKGAVIDTRRIRQENIELLARTNITAKAKTIEVDGSEVVNIHSAVQVNILSEAKISLSAPQISMNGV
ncbi:hypothetical protein [Acinetobacter sp. ANC 3813]|uniref:hypothetical protein n=1 Tax=Acinetobacter sp. ANC 3813 TaxID=1977873 RepID=UPI000A33CFE2|nr:hypothetical protein [Acinetobacter sp. ANC 3813]OTG87876.1 hypothetical protein B9T34_16195 [Acinetobacter sp. ANC 3813]